MNKDDNYRTNVESIANHYGVDAQVEQLAEEAQELADAAIEYHDDPIQKRREHLAEEIADVQVMIDQVVKLLDIKGLVYQIQAYKLMRQLDRIKSEGDAK